MKTTFLALSDMEEGKKSSGLVAAIDKSFLSSKMTACRNHFLQKTVPKMRKMFLVTYLIRNERFLRFLLNMYLYFCDIILVTIIEN